MGTELSAPNIARRTSLKGHRRQHCVADRAGRRERGNARSISGSRRFAAKAVARGITEATYTRVMRGLHPDTTGLEAIRNQPEFSQQLWQYLNRVTSDWNIATGKEKAKQYAPLFARIEKDFGVERAFMLGVWGIEFDVRRSGRGKEPYAAGHSVAGDAGLGRAAPARLLAAGTHQRADDRSARLEHARRNGRLLGRRHGPYAMDAGGLAPRRHRLRSATATSRRSGRPTMRSARPLASSSSAANIAAASTGAMKCACRAAVRSAGYAELCRLAGDRRQCAPMASRFRSRTPRRGRGCRCRAARLSCSAPISLRRRATIRR